MVSKCVICISFLRIGISPIIIIKLNLIKLIDVYEYADSDIFTFERDIKCNDGISPGLTTTSDFVPRYILLLLLVINCRHQTWKCKKKLLGKHFLHCICDSCLVVHVLSYSNDIPSRILFIKYLIIQSCR